MGWGSYTTVLSVHFCIIVLLSSGATLVSAQNAGDKQTPAQPTSNDTHDVIEKITNLKVRVLIEEPYIMRSPEDPTKYEGIFIDVLEEICRRTNLTYEITPQIDGVYGHEYSPGNWSGLIGSLQKKEAHLAVAPLILASKRHDVVDFTQPVMSAGLRILYKLPSPWRDTDSFTIMLSPFTPGTWVLVFLMFITVSIFFYIIGRFSPYEDHAFVGKAATFEGLTFINSFLYTFSSLTFQGYTAAPRSMSGRVLAAVWWMFVMLVIASYTASLCAVFLSFKPSIRSLPFTTFDELSKQSEVGYGITQNGMTRVYLSGSKRPLQTRLWGTIKANGDKFLFRTFQEGMLRLQKSEGDLAFIMEGPTAEYMAGLPPCNLMTLGEELSEHSYGFACQKGTDVCNTLNQAILQVREEDLIYDYKNKWLNRGCSREDPSAYVYHGLSFFDTFGGSPKYFAERTVSLKRFGIGFLLIFIGLVGSGCILLGEIFYAKRRGSPVPQRMPSHRAVGMDDRERIDREFRDEDA